MTLVALLVEHRTGTSPTQVRFPVAARDFSPRVNFQCRLSYGVRTPLCAIAYIYVCMHVKDPVVHVRVRWIKETLKHPACTVGWVARPCRSRLSPGRQPEFTLGKSHRDNTVVKKKKASRLLHLDFSVALTFDVGTDPLIMTLVYLLVIDVGIIIISPLTARVVGAPQMILQPVFSIFPCSPLPSGTCRTPGLSILLCCLPTFSSDSVPCKMVLARPDERET